MGKFKITGISLDAPAAPEASYRGGRLVNSVASKRRSHKIHLEEGVFYNRGVWHNKKGLT